MKRANEESIDTNGLKVSPETHMREAYKKMGSEKMNQLDKLNAIWSSVFKNEISMYQYMILRHLLGFSQQGLDINITYHSQLGTEDINPNYLYRCLVGGVSKLITKAYPNYLKESSVVTEQSEIIRVLQSDLKTMKQQINSLNLDNQTYAGQIKKYQGYLQESDEKMDELKDTLSVLRNENEGLKAKEQIKLAKDDVPLNIINARMDEEVRQNKILTNKVESLEEQIQELEMELSGYKKNEKQLLPLLQQTAYCKEHMGKSITLVPSQIENIIRGHLNGDSSYHISKDLGVSKTSVNKILSCDYRTVNSLKKILDTLHSINGNWGPEKKKELDNLISNYEIALKQAEEKAEILRNDIDNRVVDINGYFHEINGKQK